METNRLILRAFAPGDFDDFAELIRDKARSKYAPYDQPFPVDDAGLRQVLSYFAASGEFFAMELKENGRVIGYVGLNDEGEGARNLGFCVHSAYQRRGFAFEAVTAAMEYAKTALHARKLISGTAEENVPSVALLKKAGFIVTGKSRGSFTSDERGDPIVFTGLSFERAER